MKTQIDIRQYAWTEENRPPGFSTWEEEIGFAEDHGYGLVRPDYKIPHWFEGERGGRPLPILYVHTRNGFRVMDAALGRYAAELGYPLFFRKS
jgi:hypothetical protein